MNNGSGNGVLDSLPVVAAVVQSGSATTSTLSSSANIFTTGSSCLLTATVTPVDGSGVAPTGTVQFYEDGRQKDTVTLGANGTATLTWTANTPTTPTTALSFVYSGDANYTTSTSNAVVQTYLEQSRLGAGIGNATVPSTAVAGQPFKTKVPVAINNTSDTLAGTYTIELYADTSINGLTGNQVALQTVTKHATLKPGKKLAVNLTTKSLPTSLATGTYHLLVEITDPDGNADIFTVPKTFSAAAPVVSLSASVSAAKPATIALNKTGSVTVTVSDTGNVSAVGSLVITLSPSLDGVTTVAGETLATLPARHVTLKTTKPGKYTLHFKAASSLAPGTYYAIAAISLDGASATAVSTPFTAG